jgi:hypothetical protein
VETAQTGHFGISSFRLTAYLAVLLLVGVVGWTMGTDPTPVAQNTQVAAGNNSDFTDDPLVELAANANGNSFDGVTPLGAQVLAQTIVAFDRAVQQSSSTEAGIAAVKNLGEQIRLPLEYRSYSVSDIATVSDTSKDRMLSYRADLRVALEPLLLNKEYELDIFARFVESNDTKYLSDLRIVSQNYRQAIARMEKVVAPTDAAFYHASILTALSEFSVTLDALADNATDPLASAALLRNFVGAQNAIVTSFDAIGKYAYQKLL